MAEENGRFEVPMEEVVIGYQNELAEANHKNIVLAARVRALVRERDEALEDNARMRRENVGASASAQEASE